MSQYSLAGVLSSCRDVVGDNGTGKESVVRLEEFDGFDGVKTQFPLKTFPVMSGTVTITKNGSTLVETPPAPTGDYGVDYTNGVITFTVAPVTSPTRDSIYATYAFLNYADADYNSFIATAGHFIGVVGVGATTALQAASVVSLVVDAQIDALVLYVAHLYCKRKAVESAKKFGGSTGGLSVGVEVVTKAYEAQAKAYLDQATVMRDDYYKRRGAREAPSMGTNNWKGVRSWGPTR